MFWDFIQQRPETTHHILKVFSDLTTPESLRMINGSVLTNYKSIFIINHSTNLLHIVLY